MLTDDAVAVIEAELAKGVKGAPSLVHANPGPHQLAVGGKATTRRRLGRASLYVRKANPNHDERGRFTTADAHAEHAASDAMRAAGVRDYHPDAGPIRGAMRAAVTAAHAKAQQLAAKIKHVVYSTRLVHAKPIANGGVELALSHRTAGSSNVKPAKINTVVQIHPYHIAGSPVATRALQATHRALSATGAPLAPVRHPAVSATFSRD